MFPGSNIVIHGGTFINQTRTSKGMDILMEWVANGAFHNSKELHDTPKCHPHTRVAVLNDIMQWVGESESERDDFMMWLFGPAGAGKSAIAKRIAEIAAERGLLIADFFFSRTSPTRNTTDRLIATIAYQLTIEIPKTRSYIEDVIENDPGIFHKSMPTQIDSLLIRPLQSVSSTQIFLSQKLIIIDGLDECNDSKAQVAILEAISRSFPQHNLPIKFLVVSRPEPDIVTSFNFNESLKSTHRRLALDDTYRPNDDIRLFFSDKFDHIKRTHLLRSYIPLTWPTQGMLEMLVAKSSGQFIYASTVVKFVESSCHQPPARLNIILGISPPGRINPFAELDTLYNHLLSSVDDIQTTLRVLSFYVMAPSFAYTFHNYSSSATSPEQFLSLEPGDIQLALINLSSILTYHERSGQIKILHASFVDFLSDQHRSTTFYIDKASTWIDFICRILECVKGPDGIRAGNIRLFRELYKLWVPDGPTQLRSDILNFDLDAFINASIRCYKEHHLSDPGSTMEAFYIWKAFLTAAGLEYTEALDRLNKSYESRLQVYQSDWRLQLLLTLAATLTGMSVHSVPQITPFCRGVDILLEMDDHCYLHLVDQRALDLRHAESYVSFDLTSRVDGNAYASLALHCMRFLSNPPKYSERNGPLEMGSVYAEWKSTCKMTFQILFNALQRASALPELVQFIGEHVIHPEVQESFSTRRICKVNAMILKFLDRASRFTKIKLFHMIEEWSSDHETDMERLTPHRIPQRLDLCCSKVHK